MSKKTAPKNHTCTPFYRVKITLRMPGYQSVLLEGMYLPKPGTVIADGKQMRRETLDYLDSHIKWDKLGVSREECKMDVTYKAMPNSFIIVEGKDN